MRIKCIIKYNGAHFYGFQKQPGLMTVQGELERVLNIIHKRSKVKIFVSGSGRTDAKVHARGQTIHFDTPLTLLGSEWTNAMNRILHPAIRVVESEAVDDDFHVRYSAKAKTYQYFFKCGPQKSEESVFDYETVAYLPWKLDIERMQRVISMFEGHHDFTAFCRVDENRTPLKTIFKASLEAVGDNAYVITFYGSGFLRYQVRTMVGTLTDFGRYREKLPTILEIIESKDRTKAGITAPPEGLYLISVEY